MAKTTKTKVQFKRFLFVLFTLAILVTVTAFAASAAEVVDSGTCGENLTWTLDSDGALTIAGTGDTQAWSWNELAPWYSHRESIKSVTISEGVTSIDYYAFVGCYNLKDVYYQGNLTGWLGIRFIDYSSNPCYYGANLYFNGELVEEVTIPEGVTSIGHYAFYGCGSIINISIPDSVTSVGNYAFYESAYYDDESNWTDNVLYIGKHLIGAKTSISGAYSVKSDTKSIAGGAFSYCSSLEGITIPEGVTSIGEVAFYECSHLVNIVIPDSVTSVGNYAFYESAYYDDESNWTDNVLYIGKHLIGAKTSISGAYSVKSDTKSIAGGAFYDCSSLTSVTIPEGVTTIGLGAFIDCISLESITIPEGVTSIGDYAFDNCISLESITIPEGVTSIGDYAFSDCISLESVTFAENSQLDSIGEGAFALCTNLESVTIPKGVTSIDEFAFCGCMSLESVTIPEGVTSIGEDAFDSCVSLENITVLSTVTEIGDMAMGYTYVRLVGNVSEYIEVYSAIISAEIKSDLGLISEEEYEQITADAEARMEELAEELDSPVLIDGFTVTGYVNTAVQTYATENNIPFINIEGCEHSAYISKQAKPASCTEDGYTAEVKCSVCREIITASEVITALGHSYGEWSVTREANVASVGEKQRRCSVCNDVESEEIDKLDGITISDDETEFAVSYGEGTFEDGVEMTTEQIFDGTVYQALDRKYGKCEVFDISFKQNGKVVQPDGTVWVSFPLPEGYDADYTAVYYINEAGESVKMNSYCYNNYIYFEATHFSVYSIVDESSLVDELQEEIMKYKKILSFFIRLLELVFKFVTSITG